MTITINLKKIGQFVGRHKEAVLVACITVPVIINQARAIQSMNGFMTEKGVFYEYYGLDEL